MESKRRKRSAERQKSLTLKQKIAKYTEGGKTNYNFIYQITINQKPVVDNGWDLDLIDLCVFEVVKQIYSHVFSEDKTKFNVFSQPIIDELGNWAFISESYISKNIPLLPLSSSGAVYKRLLKLEECGLVERHPFNKAKRTKLIRLGKNASLLTFTKKEFSK